MGVSIEDVERLNSQSATIRGPLSQNPEGFRQMEWFLPLASICGPQPRSIRGSFNIRSAKPDEGVYFEYKTSPSSNFNATQRRSKKHRKGPGCGHWKIRRRICEIAYLAPVVVAY